ncbi:MAG TPA: glycosyl transferase family 90 [Pirellulales bacterium]|nr:glycosyl transferase family 90 [Pirellulales bacterium]
MWNLHRARRANLVLHFTRRGCRYRIDDRGGYESRNAATIHLLVEALEHSKRELARNFRLPIYTDDFVARPPGVRHFAYCTDGAQPTTIAIPDFLFWGWPQVGVPDYEHMVESLTRAGQREPEDSRLFWIGNPQTHPTRGRFLELAQSDPRILATGVTWIHGRQATTDGRMATVDNQYATLEDHCRYRYLIDLQGRGFSARVKLLLFTGRPLFLQARRWQEFYYVDLKPWEHYIPVAEDLSDLSARIDWADSHPAEARAIADNARQFALTHLRRRHAIDFLARRLVEFAAA